MKLKFSVLLLVAAMLLPSAISAAEINGRGTVLADVLNVRTSPDMDAGVKAKLTRGQQVEIITKTGDWFEILLENEILYVHSDYVKSSRKKVSVVLPEEPEKPEIPENNFLVGDEDEIKITTQTPEGQAKAAEVVEFAKQFLGTPYQWGGKTPEEGFDCSGLVYYVYGEFGKGLYRVAKDQLKNGVAVDLEHLMPGDIVLFWNRTSYSEINHVGIYVGNGEFIHAPQTGDVVKFTTLETGYYAKNLVAARRIFE